MTRYAKTTIVSADQTLLEIKKLLERYGAPGFAFAEEGQQAAVVFVFHDRRFQMPITLPAPPAPALWAAGWAVPHAGAGAGHHARAGAAA
jgi:hypothetical protein